MKHGKSKTFWFDDEVTADGMAKSVLAPKFGAAMWQQSLRPREILNEVLPASHPWCSALPSVSQIVKQYQTIA